MSSVLRPPQGHTRRKGLQEAHEIGEGSLLKYRGNHHQGTAWEVHE